MKIEINMSIKGIAHVWGALAVGFLAVRCAATPTREWHKTSPRDIVDSFYRPGQHESKAKAFPGPHTNEAWLAMSTEDFLPCIDRYGQFRHRDWPGKVKCDDDLKRAAAEEERDLAAHPGPTNRGRFGGWADGPQLDATGRFRTHKDKQGRWWLVDPDGHLFWSFGPVRVSASSGMTPMNGDNSTPRTGVATTPRDCFFEELPPTPDSPGATPFSKFWTTHDELLWSFFLARGETRVYDFSSANLYRKYGVDYYAKFSDLAHRRIRSWGANTIANSSDLAICLMDRTPYAERVECESRRISGSHGQWWKFRDPWDEGFATGVTAVLEEHGREAHDPWCIGFFVDNEINWGGPTDLAKWILQSPADQPAKMAFADWLEKKYGSFAAIGTKWGRPYSGRADFLGSTVLPGEGAKDDLYKFSCVVIDEYFRRTREAVKAFDPDLLYLGCRFAGRARTEVATASAKHCDVVSYNIYRETIGDWRLPAGLDAPVMIGEFHFGATDRGPFGAGICQAENQIDRAEKMKAYVRSALENPQIVGVHWHQFSDQATAGRFDGEYFQVGWTDVCDTPYPETVAALRELGASLYDGRAKAPGTNLRKGNDVPTTSEMRGPFPIMSTPYLDDGSVDYDGLVREAEWIVRCGSPGAIWCQSNDSIDLLTTAEKYRGFDVCAGAFEGTGTILALGANGTNTAEMLEIAAEIENVATRHPATKLAMVARPPDDVRTEDALEKAWDALGAVARRPVIFQTFCSANTPTPSVEMMVRLAKKHPEVFGYIKEEAAGNSANERMIKESSSKPIVKTVFSGWGGWQWLYQLRHCGSEGLITERVAYLPLIMRVWREYERGDPDGKMTDAFALYRLLIDQRNFPGGGLRDYSLYFLEKEGVFKNRLSRRYAKAHETEGGSFGSGKAWKLGTVEISERQKAELDILFKKIQEAQ